MQNNRYKSYPFIDFVQFEEKLTKNLFRYHFKARTSYRIKGNDGKWYWGDMVKSATLEFKPESDFAIEFLRRCHAEAYFMTHCGIVSTVTYDFDDKPLFYLDENQQDEKDRLKWLSSVAGI